MRIRSTPTARRGQALIETALVTPILLILILGVVQVGLGMLTSLRLTHAAQQAAVVGANEPAVPQRCNRALEAVPRIYGSEPDESQCTQPGNVLEIRLIDAAPRVGPWGEWNISAVGRAMP